MLINNTGHEDGFPWGSCQHYSLVCGESADEIGWFTTWVTSHEGHGVSNHRQLERLFNIVCRQIAKHQSFVLLTLCEGNPPVTGGFLSQMVRNEESTPPPPISRDVIILDINKRSTREFKATMITKITINIRHFRRTTDSITLILWLYLLLLKDGACVIYSMLVRLMNKSYLKMKYIVTSHVSSSSISWYFTRGEFPDIPVTLTGGGLSGVCAMLWIRDYHQGAFGSEHFTAG